MSSRRPAAPTTLAACVLVAGAAAFALLGAGCAPEGRRPESAEINEPESAAEPERLETSPGWWRSAVLYEIFVRSFADSDGDGVGDLQGLISKLDYLNDGDPTTDHDLGVGGVWLMPVMASPSYHGYDVVDYRQVDEDYGTNADLQELVHAAHARGIRVILDLVLNHTSDRHPWFRDAYRPGSPYHDWYIWAYEGHTYRGPWGQAVWHQLPWWKRGWRHFNCCKYYGLFSPHMPDLDQTNPRVEQEMHEIARFWLEQIGVDGFRLDAARHLVEDGTVLQDAPGTHEWLRRFASMCRSVRPDVLLIGEVWDETDVIATYGPDELDLAFGFALARETLRAVGRADRTQLVEELERTSRLLEANRFASFLTNHDQNRVMWHLDGRVDRAALAAGLLLTGPGVPFLYYGEELGISGHKPDRDIRTPMQWSADRHAGFSTHRPWHPLKASYHEVNVARQTDDPTSLLSTYRRLIRLRSEHPALSTGSTRVLETGSHSVHALLRQAPGETLLVLANLAETSCDRYQLELPDTLDTPSAVHLLYGPTAPSSPAASALTWPIPVLEPTSLYVVALPALRSPSGAEDGP